MKNLYAKKTLESVSGKRYLNWFSCINILFFSVIGPVSLVTAQTVLFEFENAPPYTPLPISLTVSGLTAHFSATGQGYSIQEANVLGFVPQGFAGRVIYRNSINLADLIVNFDQPLTDFSIMYSCQELGCDDAATMRVTAYMNNNLVGTNTRTASIPGTWPVDTLSCSFLQGFNKVVVHYDSPPPTCQDYGVIFMADNMRVIALTGTAILQGTVTYKNVANSPITNSIVQLKQNGIVVNQTTTDTLGNYSFTNLVAGTYNLECNIIKPWGGGNSVDALLILKHFVGLITLTDVNLQAADLDGSQSVNAVDALLDAKRFVQIINSFAVPDWVTASNSETLTGTGTTVVNLQVLCAGDVNGSLL